MALTDILLRYTAHPPLTTKGSELTFVEGDANLIEIYEYLQSLASAGGIAPWNAGTTYNGTTYVTFSGNLWQHVTSSSTGITPGTNPAVWALTSIGQLAHVQNTDAYLDFGGANQVSAAELKALLNDHYKTVTRAVAITQRNSATLKPGYWYYISDERIALHATSVNGLSTSGYFLAYDADYGNASGSMLVASTDAIWGDTSSYWWSDVVATYPVAANRIGKHCIYRGKHYRNLTGSNHPSDAPDVDTTNWVVATTGHASYRRNVDAVIYDIDTNEIMQRADKYGNLVKRGMFVTTPLEAQFQFGNVNVKNNVFLANADIAFNRGSIYNNYVDPGSYLSVIDNGANGTLTSASFSYNHLVSSNVAVNGNEGAIGGNRFNHGNVNVNGQANTGLINNCEFTRCNATTFSTNDANFTYCSYSNLDTVELGLVGTSGAVWLRGTFDRDVNYDGLAGTSYLTISKGLSEFSYGLSIADVDTAFNYEYKDKVELNIGGTGTATVDFIDAKHYNKVVKIAPDSGSILVVDCGPGNIMSLDGTTTTYTLDGSNGDYMLGVYTADDFFEIIKIAQP